MMGNRVDKKGQSLIASFSCAIRGILWVTATQRNMKIHYAAAVLVILAAVWIRLSALETALLVLAIALVTVAEIINSAIEKTVDLITTECHPLAGKAKDAAAGAVLLAAFFSAVIGLLVFLPHLVN